MAVPYTGFMLRIHKRHVIGISVFIVLVGVIFEPQTTSAWGNEGHRLINRLAINHLPADAPAFLGSEAALFQRLSTSVQSQIAGGRLPSRSWLPRRLRNTSSP